MRLPEALMKLGLEEANKNQALLLDDHTAVRILNVVKTNGVAIEKHSHLFLSN